MKQWHVTLRKKLTLAQQYALASLAVLLVGMLLIGWWVSQQIQQGVIQNTAVTAALYVNSFVAPEIQELANQDYLSKEKIDELQQLLVDTPLGKSIPSVKIWGPDGKVVYGSRASIIGQTFPVTSNLAQAWQGNVTAEFSGFDDEENAHERQLDKPLLEIYSPVREHMSDRIIAVAEFYKDSSELEAHLFRSRVESWLMTTGVTLGMFILLFGIVYRGSRTIEYQQNELHQKIQDLSDLLSQNKELNERVRNASVQAVKTNERFLRRISAELHDGPAQSIGFALLRLDAIDQFLEGCQISREQGKCPNPDSVAVRDLTSIHQALKDALTEIRNLSSGLALPQLDELTPLQVLQRVTRAHTRRTCTEVGLNVDNLPTQLPLSYKICIYRFVQEALNNAFQHAEGLGQQVHVTCDKMAFLVEVSDTGPGFNLKRDEQSLDTGLGLVGMRERIESLAGSFSITSAPEQGTRLRAKLPLTSVMEGNYV